VQSMKTSEFLNLPLNALVALLGSDDIIVDSENTVFYAVIVWIQWNHVERIPFMETLLYSIRFPMMTRYFLLDCIPHVADQFPEPIRRLLMEMRSFGLESKSGENTKTSTDPALTKQFTERMTYMPKKLTIKFVFVNISQMDTTKKIYSGPVFWCGYEFSFFLRPINLSANKSPNPLENSAEPSDFALAGFLRCTSKLLPLKHYLPVCYSLRVASREYSSERKFTDSRVIFEATDRAIGSKLTLPNENLSQIISGESSLVIDDTLTVTVDIELLENDDNCTVITEA